jgi:hypothetical protein
LEIAFSFYNIAWFNWGNCLPIAIGAKMETIIQLFCISMRMINLAEIKKNNYSMTLDKKTEEEKKEGTVDGIADKLIDKAEEFIDETADKIYNSESYRKAGESMEKATLSIFRKAGKWWGKL